MKKRLLTMTISLVLMVVMAVPALAASVFRDVDDASPWYDGISYAVEHGITVGTGENCFSPEWEITVRQWAVMVCRALGTELPQKDLAFGAESVRAGHDAGWLDLNAFLAPDTRMTRGNLYESAFHAFDIPIYDYDLYDNGIALNQSQNCIRIGSELGLCSEDADDSELVTRAEAVHVIYWLLTQEYEVAKPEILDRLNIQHIEDTQLDAYVKEIKKVPQSILDRFAAWDWSYRLDCSYLEDLSKRLDMTCIGAASYREKTIYVAKPSATIHEFGHFLHGALGFPQEFNLLYAEEAANTVKVMRDYSATNCNEYFADYFRYWIENQGNSEKMEQLRVVSPKTFEYFSELARNDWYLGAA